MISKYIQKESPLKMQKRKEPLDVVGKEKKNRLYVMSGPKNSLSQRNIMMEKVKRRRIGRRKIILVQEPPDEMDGFQC